VVRAGPDVRHAGVETIVLHYSSVRHPRQPEESEKPLERALEVRAQARILPKRGDIGVGQERRARVEAARLGQRKKPLDEVMDLLPAIV
jgi:hypothetical protein